MESTFEKELESLGRRIKQLRKHRKLRLLDLEMLSGVNDSDLSRYERGKENIELHTLYKLARALEVEIADLTSYDGVLPDNTAFVKPTERKRLRKK
jgi:transcriptional regulator with XRE-family HTH domain